MQAVATHLLLPFGSPFDELAVDGDRESFFGSNRLPLPDFAAMLRYLDLIGN
jgi:hypothetical protein